MAQTDVERLARLVLDEFTTVHVRLDKHDERFDRLDHRLDRMVLRFDAVESELHSIRTELGLIRNDLIDLAVRVDNVSGFREEIDHALERIAEIEKHLGISKNIA